MPKRSSYSSGIGWEIENAVDDACKAAYDEGYEDGFKDGEMSMLTKSAVEEGVELVKREVEYKGETHIVWIRW